MPGTALGRGYRSNGRRQCPWPHGAYKKARSVEEPLWKIVWHFLVKLYIVQHPTPEYLPKRNENLCSPQNLCVTVYSDFICSHPQNGNNPMSFNWCEVKQNMYSYTTEYHIPIKYKERLIHATKWIMFSGGPHTLYFHLYDILAKVKFRDREQFSHCQEQSMKEGVEYKGAQANFRGC